MYQVKHIIEPTPNDYSLQEWQLYFNSVPDKQRVCWQLGNWFLDEGEAQQICLDAYIQRAIAGRFDIHTLQRTYKMPDRITVSASLLSHAVHVPAILSTLQYRLGFVYSGNQKIDMERDDFLKRNFSAERIPFHLPLLCEPYGSEMNVPDVYPSCADWFQSQRYLVEVY